MKNVHLYPEERKKKYLENKNRNQHPCSSKFRFFIKERKFFFSNFSLWKTCTKPGGP